MILLAISGGVILGMLLMAIFIAGDSADLGTTRQALLSDLDYLLKHSNDNVYTSTILRMKKRIKEDL